LLGNLSVRRSSTDKNQKESGAKVTLPGTVEKIIPAIASDEPEKAQIAIDGAEDLYREIRIDNVLEGKNGKQVSLKPGAQVDVTIQADPDATVSKKP
jgi:hypothetical protein